MKNRKDNEKDQNWEDYEKNLLCLQDVMDRLLSCMKGHNVSFRAEITDRDRKFSHKKLCSLVKKLLSLWAKKQQESTFENPDTGENLANPYIEARRELYGSYLYLVMRCCLLEGKYTLVCGREMKERTDFAFLLEQAKRLFRSWCVMGEPDGNKKNELFFGYDDHFGFHLYRVLSSCPAAGFDNLLVPELDWPVHHPAFLTDEGSVKRISLKDIYRFSGKIPWTTEASQPDADGPGRDDGCEGDSHEEDGYDTDSYDGEGNYEGEESYDVEEDYDGYEPEEDEGFYDVWEELDVDAEAQYEATRQILEKQEGLGYLYDDFECPEEYLKACRLFKMKFQEAEPEVLRGFYEDLEEIVSLYLVGRNIPPLTDEDTVMEMYSSIYDGPYRQARHCAKRVQCRLALGNEPN